MVRASNVKLVIAERERIMQAAEAELAPHQLAAINSEHRFNANHWGRRTGKSKTIPRALGRAVCLAGAESPVIAGAETKDKAKALYWSGLMSALQRWQVAHSWRTDAGKGTIKTPWGSWIQLWGCKDETQVDLLRGFPPYEAHFDEVATYDHLLRKLTGPVLKPALTDHRNRTHGGRLFLWGTPSYVRAGYWFQICNGDIPGWHTSRLDVRSNPFFDDPTQVLLDEIRENRWDHADFGFDGVDPESCLAPEFMREWLGLFVNDGSVLVYQYNEARNGIDALPAHYDSEQWVHTMALDFGVVDECAWAVWASHPQERIPYLIYADKSLSVERLTPEDCSVRTAPLVERYDPDVLVGDSGGLGAAYVEDWNRRGLSAITMIPAQKTEKAAAIRMLNGDLRKGIAKVIKSACVPFTSEASSLPWKDEMRLVEHPGFPNHACDATLYGHRHHTSYLHEIASERSQKPDPRPDWHQRHRQRMRRKVSRRREFWDDSSDDDPYS